jgi:hypothetical protein
MDGGRERMKKGRMDGHRNGRMGYDRMGGDR